MKGEGVVMVDEQRSKTSFIGRFRAGGEFGGLAEILFPPKKGNQLSENVTYTGKLIEERKKQIKTANGKSSNIISDLWRKIENLFVERNPS